MIADLQHLVIDPSTTIVGVDVGEDFLDLATLRPNTDQIEHARVALSDLGPIPTSTLSDRLLRAVPGLNDRCVALIDSPSLPIDLTAGPPPSPRLAAPKTRDLDRSLRLILARLDQPLALFPTPALSIFARQSTASSCKPHLKSIFAGS